MTQCRDCSPILLIYSYIRPCTLPFNNKNKIHVSKGATKRETSIHICVTVIVRSLMVCQNEAFGVWNLTDNFSFNYLCDQPVLFWASHKDPLELQSSKKNDNFCLATLLRRTEFSKIIWHGNMGPGKTIHTEYFYDSMEIESVTILLPKIKMYHQNL